jgi:hypothetical protein
MVFKAAWVFIGVAGLSLAAALLAPTVDAQSDSFPTDDRGFIDSEARCEEPSVAVAFGRTERALVAICMEDGEYEYRGVRLRDDAELVIPAKRSDGAGFVAENDGVTYWVTAKSLVVSVGERVLRDDAMIDFKGPDAAEAGSSTPSTSLPPPLPAEVGGSDS